MILRDQFDVSTADGGARAIEFMKEKDFDVVVLDIRMPDISGIEVLERIKEINPSSEVAMVTAYAALDTAKHAMRYGAYDYIEKPFKNPDELREVVRRGVERKMRTSKMMQLMKDFDEVRKQLIQLEKLSSIGRMTSEVVHELAGPITGVLGYSELLMMQECDDIIKSSLRKINTEAERCQEIIHNFLAFARKSDPSKNLVSINDVAQKTIDIKAHQLKLDDVEVAMDLDPDLPDTMANFNQIQQVIINMVNNAHQAMKTVEGKRQLTITTQYISDPTEIIRVSIADTGPGIPPDMIEKIFEPFFTTKSSGEGTGLGLSISREIAHEHRGEIYVESKEGEGATFILEIPVENLDLTMG